MAPPNPAADFEGINSGSPPNGSEMASTAELQLLLQEDLYGLIDKMRERGVRNKAGRLHYPTYYKRGLDNAVAHGGDAVVEYARRRVHQPVSSGFITLKEGQAADLTVEALIADESKPYASLFTPLDRRRARGRLAMYRAHPSDATNDRS